jgi:two-component system, OmpR family, alkaline phosphatase synthesis response regulator PhoP
MAPEGRVESQHGPAPKVLVVDDEQNVVDLLRSYLEAEGFSIIAAHDGNGALQKARAEQPDLIVLDWMLPGLDGMETCRKLRLFSDAYVLMLSAKSEETDKVVGLSVGADDYLTKPFSPRELVARIKAMLRRPRSAGHLASETEPLAPLVFENLMINMDSHEVMVEGEIMHLTRREFDLLATLATHPGRVFTRSQLLERVWGDRYYDEHVVDVHITNLRKKLGEDPASPRFVETVRGVGYRMRSP